MRKRDENAPAALSVSERAELAALRRVNRLQEVMIAQKNEALANLKILLKDAYVQRDRVLGELRSSAETAGNKKLDCSGVIQVIEHYLQYDLHESHEESALVMESGDAWRVLAEIGAALDKAKWLC
jgi:hypothetical protein